MQNSPRVSSSDLERARALALRLSQDPASPDRAPAPPTGVYVRFSASRFRGAVDEPPPTASAEARALGREPAVPRPEPRVAPPEPPAAPPVRPAPPPPPPRSAAPPPAEVEEVEEPPAVFMDTSAAEVEVEAETELEMEEVAEAQVSPEATPAAEPGAATLPELNPEPSEFEEDLEPLPWSQILDDSVYLAHGRGAFVMNAKGQITEVTGPWPKPKLEPIGARLMKLMDEATAAQGKGAPSPAPTLQLGTFCLTGLRVAVAGQDVTVGLIAEAALSPDVRPAIEAELRRGRPV